MLTGRGRGLLEDAMKTIAKLVKNECEGFPASLLCVGDVAVVVKSNYPNIPSGSLVFRAHENVYILGQEDLRMWLPTLDEFSVRYLLPDESIVITSK